MSKTETTNNELQMSKARIGFMRQPARKVRRTVNLVRGMNAAEAMKNLRFMPYAAAKPIFKLIQSAVANAADKGIAKPDQLLISQILVDDGPVFKRWRAASKGRGVSVHKRTSQVSVILSPLKAAEYAQYVWDNSPRNKKNQKKEAK